MVYAQYTQCATTARDCICELHKGCGLLANPSGDLRPILEIVRMALRLGPVAIVMHDMDATSFASDMFACLDLIVDQLLKV